MQRLARSTAVIALAIAAAGARADPPRPPAEGAVPSDDPLPRTLAGRIVFVRAQHGRNVLMAMNPDGTGQVSLRVHGSKPHVAPDGRRVAYTTPDGAVAVLDLGTGTETVLATASVIPRWSPDGRRIVFWRRGATGADIWIMAADGSAPVRLTRGGGENLEADWSPDGARIVFRRNTGDGGDIWTMNADGTDAAMLYAGARMDSDPRWSPDGRRIAFVRLVPRAAGGGLTSDIFVIDADGSNLVRVTHHDGTDWSPAWSPDGARIAFFGFRTGPDDPDIFTVRPDGTDLRVLLGEPTYDHGPAYGPSTEAAGAANHEEES